MTYTVPPQQRRELEDAIYRFWTGTSAAAKRAAAACLLSCPELGASSSHVAAALKYELGMSTQQMGLGPFRQLIQCAEPPGV
jgi:hypothetical protein